MDWDEPRAKTKAGITPGEKLDGWSVAELEARVAALEAEIARTKAEIGAKRKHNAAADALFKR
ncbi:MAG: DUF1192 domain-containing protein [Hyphomicrobiaceae bacterium]